MKKFTLKHLLLLATLVCTVLATTLITASAAHGTNSQTTDVKLDIVANNVSYSDSIYILYAIANEGFDRTEHEIQMLFWNEAQEVYALGTEKYATTNQGTKKVKGKDCLIFYSAGIAAKEMTDDIYARACVVIDGREYYSDVMKFSVLEYVYTMREQGNVGQGQLNLFTSMLNYGTAAQHNFGHHTHRPANGTYHKITVIGGTTPDGFRTGRYLEGQKVVITPDEPERGMRFAYWKDEQGIVVSYDAAFEVTVGKKNKTFTAIYRDISSISAQLKLTTEIPYDGTVAQMDLPTAVSFTHNGESIILDVTWDTSAFLMNTVGKQTLYASLTDPSGYREYGIEPGSIVMEVTTLPFTLAIDQATGNYILTGYYGTDASVTVPTAYRNVYITTIASRAFNNVMTLESLSVPRTVTKIEQGAFWYCDNLKDITLPFIGESETSSNSWLGYVFGATAYDVQYGLLPLALESVTLMDGATKIPNYAFYKCDQIRHFNTPDTVTSIGTRAFDSCSSITEFTVPAGLTYCNMAFYGCYNLKRVYISNPSQVFTIYASNGSNSLGYSIFGMGAELWCDGAPVTEIAIPSGMTSIPGNVLTGCTSIKSVYIPASVTSVGYAFCEMSSLETVVFEEGSPITELSYTFQNCPKLTSINLGSLTKLRTITQLFSGCTSLSEITLPDSITDIGSSSFSRTAIRAITLPSGIQKIGDSTFSGCTNLESIVIPAGVVEIGDYAFRDCTSLRSVELPSALTAIEGYAFYGCTSLAAITLPERLHTIGSSAFQVSGLTTITILSDTLTSIGSYAFNNCHTLVEIYNLSQLPLSIGSSEYGEIAKNAQVIHTSLDTPSCVSIDAGGFIFCPLGEETWLMRYVGTESQITLPTLDVAYKIYPNAFRYTAHPLTSVVIPDGVSEIGEYAFSYQSKLYSVALGRDVSVIGDSAFTNCYKLSIVINRSSHITLEKDSSNYGYVAYFADIVYNSADEPLPYRIEETDGFVLYIQGDRVILLDYVGTDRDVTVPDSVTEIANYAFYQNYTIQSVSMGDSVQTIGNYAFYNCTALVAITLPEGLQSIDDSAFRYCTALAAITLPEGLQSIGDGAFYSCTALTEIVIPSSVTSLSYYVFNGCKNLTTIYCEAAEKPSNWNYDWLTGTSAEVVWGYTPVTEE